MTPVQRDRHDLKVLLVVAGGVLAAVAGIVLLAGLSARYNHEKDRLAQAAADRSAHRESRVLPSSMEHPANAVPDAVEAVYAPRVSPQAETVPEPEVAAVTATPTIDPDADLVREGLRAFANREFETAAGYFAAEIAARPGRAWASYMLGLSSWKAGRLDDAETALVEAAGINGASIRTWINLARVRNDAGRFEEALDAAERAIDIDPTDAVAHYVAARSLRNLRRVDEAVAALERTLELDPQQGHAHNLLGLIRIEQGRAAEAEAELEIAAELLPDVPYVHNNLGMALELGGRSAEAVAAYRRAVELAPGESHASANLARLGPLPATTEPDEVEAVAVASGGAPEAGEIEDPGSTP